MKQLKRILLVGLAASALVISDCGYVTVDGLELVPIGKSVETHDPAAYKAIIAPRTCFDPDTTCDLDVEIHLYALGDTLLAAAPDTLRLSMPGWDTVVVLDTADTSNRAAGRHWLWGPQYWSSGDKMDGKTVKGHYWLLIWEVARVNEGDTVSISFRGHVRRSDGALDTVGVRRSYVLQRFKRRTLVTI